VSGRERSRGRRGAAGAGASVRAGGDASQVLPMAVHEHEQGNLSRARLLYEQVLDIDPGHADAMQFLGILCHQCGEPGRAEELIRRAIAAKPEVAPYHDNLGTVLESAGRLEEALAAYAEADRLEPGDPDRGYNAGVVLQRLGRLEEAEHRFRQALEVRPEDADCRFALGNVLKARGRGEQAENAYRMVLRARPGDTAAGVNLGNLLLDQGRLEESVAAYRQALSQDPEHAGAHHNLGRALHRAGRPEDACAAFEQALRREPGLVDARIGLGRALEEVGRLDRALDAFRAACEREPASEAARAGLLRVARVYPPRRADTLLARELVDAVRARRMPAVALARVLGTQLAAAAGLLERSPADDHAALALALQLAEQPLFTTLLESTANVVPEVERWLTAARRALLADPVAWGRPGARSLLRTLALQCAHGDWVLAVGEEERAAHEGRRAAIEAWLEGGASAPEPVDVSVLAIACHEPLASLAGAEELAEQASRRGWLEDAGLAPVIRRTLEWPLQERRLAPAIRSLGGEEPASVGVRAQYEEHPYPRWSELPSGAGSGPPPGRLGDGDADPSASPLEVLIAGCGTGQEALAWATRFPAHRVLGLDLSRASLAYAQRMADDLGIETVELVQGDLMQVGALGRRFDVIAASGVLHHLAEPLQGWRALCGCLKPGGLMKVALYSRAARAPVNTARERIAALGLTASTEGVRALRSRVLAGEEPALAALLDSEDFYTTASCRDLLFHPVEHQFDLGQLAEMLAALELRFLGFELPHPLVERLFLSSGADVVEDLGAWARFEAQHPETFEAMYRFWCEPAGDGGGAVDA
jgi:tetratricopeptide (TPR) repeat protein/SAM-dependent methyltransferase